MKPYSVRFHLYAEDEEEISVLQDSLYDFVCACYKEGIYVSASRLTEAIQAFGNNPFIKNYLK